MPLPPRLQPRAGTAPRRRTAAPALRSLIGGLVCSLVGGLLACGDGAADDPSAALQATSTRAKVSLESAGANCAYGGSRIEAGLDANGNGQLDAGEVMSVQFACHGAPGAGGSTGAQGLTGAGGSAGSNALVRIDAEAAGANCAFGGARVGAGLDADGNAVLDSGEVSSTRYVCAGAAGAAAAGNGNNGSNGSNGSNGLNRLIAIVTEAPGAQCDHGGKKVTTGLDTDGNQVLDAGEVTSTSYLCHAAPGANMNWVAVGGTSQGMAANTGYLATATTQVVLTLPTNPALGDIVAVNGLGAGGWKIAQNSGQYISARSLPNDAPTGLGWITAGPTPDWQAIASSADGSKLIAAPAPGQIHTSSDAGATWTARESSRNWSAVASSADGSKLVAAALGGYLYTSADGGVSWTQRAGVLAWTGLASSADGSRLVAVAQGAQIYTSGDAGVNWSARDSARNWTAVASSNDGVKVVATDQGGQVYLSADAGTSWAPQGPTANWTSMASSADGNKLVAGTLGGQLYTSTDAGANWTARAGTRQWRALASSADGSTLLAAPDGDVIFVSTDSGVSWSARASSRAWRAVTCSDDGNKLAAVSLASLVYPASQVHLSISGRSSVGSGGGINGNQYDTLTLQYIGGGEFIPIDYSAAGAFHVE